MARSLHAFLAITFEQYRENKKAKDTELLLLKEMLNDELRNVRDLKMNLVEYELAVYSCNYFLENIGNKKETDSLAIYAHEIQNSPIFQISYSAYNNMNSLGWQIISNDSLRKEIIFIYDYYYDAMEELAHNRDFPLTNDFYLPLYNKHFNVGKQKVIDYQRLQRDSEFENVVRQLLFMKKDVIAFINRRLKKSEKLQQMINVEIRKILEK
jgi:hypothetical protein